MSSEYVAVPLRAVVAALSESPTAYVNNSSLMSAVYVAVPLRADVADAKESPAA
jgi:hypothetical protein